MKIATIVIAIINEDLDQLRNCITSIDRNRFEVIIVYPTKYHADINAVFTYFFGHHGEDFVTSLRTVKKQEIQAKSTG